MECLFENHPQWVGKVTFFLVVRDRDGRKGKEKKLSKLVDTLVGRVNGLYGKCDYTPVHYVKQTLKEEQVGIDSWKACLLIHPYSTNLEVVSKSC